MESGPTGVERVVSTPFGHVLDVSLRTLQGTSSDNGLAVRWSLGCVFWLWSGRVYVCVSVYVCGFRVVHGGLGGFVYVGFIMGVWEGLCVCLFVCFGSKGLLGKFECTFASE